MASWIGLDVFLGRGSSIPTLCSLWNAICSNFEFFTTIVCVLNLVPSSCNGNVEVVILMFRLRPLIF
jgi:hypothetical protein